MAIAAKFQPLGGGNEAFGAGLWGQGSWVQGWGLARLFGLGWASGYMWGGRECWGMGGQGFWLLAGLGHSQSIEKQLGFGVGGASGCMPWGA